MHPVRHKPLPSVLVIGLFLVCADLNAVFFGNSDEYQERIAAISAELETLPKESLNLAPWTLGYRSQGYPNPDANITITVNFSKASPVDLVVLMPSAYTEDGLEMKINCFPKRFMIERINPDGSSDVVVDYRDADYNIQGIEPQLFYLTENKLASGLRLRINKLSENETWSKGKYRAALSELLAFDGKKNVALDQEVIVDSTNNYSYLWMPEALTDGFSLHSPITRDPKNPNLAPLRIRRVENVTINFDIGSERLVDEFRFWPLVHGLQFSYPPASGVGFPRGIKITASTEANFSDNEVIFNSREIYPRTGSNPFMVRTQPTLARYIRISMDNIVHDYRIGITELAIDEIQVFSNGELISDDLLPSIEGIKVAKDELRLLTNGRTSEGELIPLRQWLIDFSRRAKLERELEALEGELELARGLEEQQANYLVSGAIGLIILLALLIWVVYLLSERRWRAIRERIACDIHDDLGASMISVAHSVELVQHSMESADERQSRLLKTAITTARRTAEDTRQIVRLLEENESGGTWTDSLRETAQTIAGDTRLVIDFQENRTFNQLNAARRWDLLLFIKEALNNAVKHAEANELKLSLYRTHGQLAVTITDDGKGISKDCLPVRHLELRAKHLNGTLKIESSGDRGTHIELIL